MRVLAFGVLVHIVGSFGSRARRAGACDLACSHPGPDAHVQMYTN